MKISSPKLPSRAFTLVELLVVISIITILAAMLFPVGQSIMQKGARSRAQTELQKVATAIDVYKTKLGFYPPGNANTNLCATNQLYYELVGCRPVYNGPLLSGFETLDRATTVSTVQMGQIFGTGGIVNALAGSDTDEAAMAQSFMKDVKPTQYGVMSSGIRVLGVLMEGPIQVASPAGGLLCPFSYNPSNPAHNVNSYDLWVDVIIGAKTNRINNWSTQPEILR
jgi:prepilin-type N-terminal cleavage/methylation domain-containing protein